MSDQAFLPGVQAATITTPRLRTFVLFAGDEGGTPIIFIHGNVSSGRFWEETLAALPAGYRGLAPDLRGYGESETLPVDATRGMGDFADDLHALVETLGLGAVHLVGWSLGGNVALQYAIDHLAQVASLTLVASARHSASAAPRTSMAHRPGPTSPDRAAARPIRSSCSGSRRATAAPTARYRRAT